MIPVLLLDLLEQGTAGGTAACWSCFLLELGTAGGVARAPGGAPGAGGGGEAPGVGGGGRSSWSRGRREELLEQGAPVVELLEQWWSQHQGAAAGLMFCSLERGVARKSTTGSRKREGRPRSACRR